ncbi:hypothetical protein [Lentzea sp.]|uniref:hypothetical protein n=1 Tax=Lentzea sp. TaxID=56099 RepID=UPI002ED1D1F3
MIGAVTGTDEVVLRREGRRFPAGLLRPWTSCSQDCAKILARAGDNDARASA